MGIKMNKVRANGKEIKINEYNPNKVYGELKCYYCNADISFVNSYEKYLAERKIVVQKYFRLKSGEEHEQGCKYTVDGIISNIYADCADDELMSNQDNKYVVRLMLIEQDIAKQEIKKFSNELGSNKKQKNYISREKKLAYLSTINQIMKLRAKVEDNSDLEDKINLKYSHLNGKIYFISWQKFYFDSEKDNDYRRLLKSLIKKEIDYPLCVAGYINSISQYKLKKFCINMEPILDEENKRIVINIYFENNDIYEKIKEKKGYKIIAYTNFKFYKEKEWSAENKKKIIYYNITGNIYENKQILILKDEPIL